MGSLLNPNNLASSTEFVMNHPSIVNHAIEEEKIAYACRLICLPVIFMFYYCRSDLLTHSLRLSTNCRSRGLPIAFFLDGGGGMLIMDNGQWRMDPSVLENHKRDFISLNLNT